VKPVVQMFSRSVTDKCSSVIDDSRVTLQLVASFLIVIYDCHLCLKYIYSTGRISTLQSCGENWPELMPDFLNKFGARLFGGFKLNKIWKIQYN